MKKLLSIALVLLLLLSSIAALAEAETINIGIMQMVDHPALNAAREGFIQALADKGYADGESISITYQNGQGDTNNLATIADKFVSDQMDLVLAIATPAAQAMAGKTVDIPIIATAVTDFVAAGLVISDEQPGTNVSGTSDMNPIADQIELLFQFVPGCQTVGFLYNSSEANSLVQIDIAKAVLDQKGVAYVERTVSSSNEVQQAAQSIVGECDAIYLPTDNVFASSMPIVSEIAVDAGIPIIGGEENQVLSGALATLGINYFNLGYQAGEMAVRVLEGADIAATPVETQSEFGYLINADIVGALGIEVPAGLEAYVQSPAGNGEA